MNNIKKIISLKYLISQALVGLFFILFLLTISEDKEINIVVYFIFTLVIVFCFFFGRKIKYDYSIYKKDITIHSFFLALLWGILGVLIVAIFEIIIFSVCYLLVVYLLFKTMF